MQIEESNDLLGIEDAEVVAIENGLEVLDSTEDDLSHYDGTVESFKYLKDYSNCSLKTFLSSVFVQFNIKQTAGDVMLKYFKAKFDNSLPRNCKTLLKTPRKVNIRDLCEGKYISLPLYEQLLLKKEHFKSLKDNLIQLDVNIDGMSVAKGSTNTMWTILCAVHDLKLKPMLFSAYFGVTKPSNFDEFLQPFVNEILDLQQKSIVVGDRVFKIKLGLLIMDTPARCIATGVVNAGGYCCCPRCKVVGELSESKH